MKWNVVVGCALGVASLCGMANAQTPYIPGNKFDYLINGLRSPTYSNPRYSGGYYYGPNAVDPGYYAGYAPRPEYVVPANAALIEMRVPANAEVWFSGEKTQQSGEARSFVTPALEPGHNYAYRIKVTWTGAKGEKVEREKKVAVRPGARVNLNFE